MTFVDKIADHIVQKGIDLRNITVVLPSERMIKYLVTALNKRVGKTIFAPNMQTIDKWIAANSDRLKIDKTRALLELYIVHQEQCSIKEDSSFDEFMTWGELLLNDFNEIDRYLVDPDQIFRNLADIKEIEQWSFNSTELSAAQQRFLEFWDKLPRYYKELNKRLDQKKQAYSGHLIRRLNENLNEVFSEAKDQYFLFAGFNAMSLGELSIIKQLMNYGRAELLMDADVFYCESSYHEAGRFIRRNKEFLQLKELSFTQDILRTKKLKIHQIACAQTTGQVKTMATLLKEKSADLSETLLLLADESLIVPVLKNLPEEIGKANITLGIPLKNTVLRTWVDLLFTLQEHQHRFNNTAFYHADILALIKHPFVETMLEEEDRSALFNLERHILDQNRVFVRPKNLGEKLMNVLELCALSWKSNWQKAIETVRAINKHLFAHFNDNSDFEKALLLEFDKRMVAFEAVVLDLLPEMSLRSFRQLLDQHWQSSSVAYHGNPTEGLQIMGLLETRGLDFKRIICLGLNEGNLPPTNPIQTLIPMDLRRHFNLPLPRDKQGLFAHHFYRLLHHCEEMYVTYSLAETRIGSPEPSRYLLQIEKELARENPGISLEQFTYFVDQKGKTERLQVILKTEEVLRKLDSIIASRVSPSMIKKYYTCPLDFYYRYILEFGEAESVEEEIENSTFGTFIHDTLEELYEPYARFYYEDKKNKAIRMERSPSPITSSVVEKMIKDFPISLKSKFLKHFDQDENAFMKGKNYLAYSMAMELTERFLKAELNFVTSLSEKLFIESLESYYEHDIEIEVNGIMKPIKLIGYIDRIDRIGEKIRVIDYKSGKVDQAQLTFAAKGEYDEILFKSVSEHDHVLQLLQYAFLYKSRHNKLPEPAIISFISGSFTPFHLDTKGLDLNDVVDDYPRILGKVFSDIYNQETQFEHKQKGQISYCKYCE